MARKNSPSYVASSFEMPKDDMVFGGVTDLGTQIFGLAIGVKTTYPMLENRRGVLENLRTPADGRREGLHLSNDVRSVLETEAPAFEITEAFVYDASDHSRIPEMEKSLKALEELLASRVQGLDATLGIYFDLDKRTLSVVQLDALEGNVDKSREIVRPYYQRTDVFAQSKNVQRLFEEEARGKFGV